MVNIPSRYNNVNIIFENMLFNNIENKNYFQNFTLISTHKTYKMSLFLKYRVQWWIVYTGYDSPEISLVRTKSVGTDFHVRTNGRFSNL